MHITLVLTVLLNMYTLFFISTRAYTYSFFSSGICIYYWITRYYCEIISHNEMAIADFRDIAGAIIFTIIALLSIVSYFGFRSRIPLASLLLQVVMDITKHHTSVYAVAFTALFVQAGLAV